MATKERAPERHEVFDSILFVETPTVKRRQTELRRSAREYEGFISRLEESGNAQKAGIFRTKAWIRRELASGGHFIIVDNDIKGALRHNLAANPKESTLVSDEFLTGMSNVGEDALMTDILVVNHYCRTGKWLVNGGDLAEQRAIQEHLQGIEQQLGKQATAAVK